MSKPLTELIEASKDILGLVDSNELVRNIERDLQPDWHQRMISLVRKLKRFQDAILEAEKEAANG